MAIPLGIALLGAGTVGSAVARELTAHADLLSQRSGGPLVLRCVADRDPERLRAHLLSGVTLVDDANLALSRRDVDIVVEVMGGLEPAGSVLRAAVQSGLGTVTANKAVIARAGPELAALVRPASGGLAFEAAVGAAIPVLAMLRDSLRGDTVQRITAVINGTTNYVLERLRGGESLDDAVAEAQRQGYAEADPSADLNGDDAAAKLCILAWFGLGVAVTPDQVDRRGIRGLGPADAAAAAQLGLSLRLVARAEPAPGGLGLSVQPTLVPASGHPLGSVEEADNVVVVDADLAGRLILRGRGAGADAAASAVVSDIVAVARARREGRSLPLPPAAPARILDPREAETASALRLRVRGRGDVPAIVTRMFEEHGIPVERVSPGGGRGELLVLLGTAARDTLAGAMEALRALPAVEAVEQTLDRLGAGVE
jgi:homoserine dehydrogenase